MPGTWNRLWKSNVFNVCEKTNIVMRKCRAPFSRERLSYPALGIVSGKAMFSMSARRLIHSCVSARNLSVSNYVTPMTKSLGRKPAGYRLCRIPGPCAIEILLQSRI